MTISSSQIPAPAPKPLFDFSYVLDRPFTERAILVLFLLAPFIYVIDNAPPDIWCVVMCIVFLVKSQMDKNWDWLVKPSWLWAAIVFWMWLMFSAAISFDPVNGLEDGATWIRFILLAVALQFLFLADARMRRLFSLSIVAAVAFTTVWLFVEFFVEYPAARLNGPMSIISEPEQQTGKIGSYMRIFGLYAAGLAVIAADRNTGWRQAGFYLFAAFVMAGQLITGEIFNTLITYFLFGIFLVLYAFLFGKISRIFAIGIATCIAAFCILTFNPSLTERVTHALENRLPWNPESDYYAPWVGAIEVGSAHQLVGVGPDNYQKACEGMVERGEITTQAVVDRCHRHPHQLYLQTFAETGVIGLALFIVMGVWLGLTIFSRWRVLKESPHALLASMYFIGLFWPIATYSHGFGQHQNLFTWLGIGIALAFVASPEQSAKNKT